MCCTWCIGSCLYKTVTSTCGCTSSSRSGSLIPYFVLQLLSVILAIVLRFGVSSELSKLYYQPLGQCDTARCIGYGAVFRVSWATFLFFFTHAILLFIPACKFVDRFSWINKFLYWIALLIVSYVFPEDFYADFYVHVCRVISGFFLFFQIVILIDMAYKLNENWNGDKVAAEDTKKYQFFTLALALLCLLVSLGLLIFFYIEFGTSGCRLQQFFISFTLCSTLLLIVLSITEKFGANAGILPASIVTLYAYWLCYSGLSSDPSSCNTLSSGRQETAQLIVGLIIGAVSIAYAGWSVGTHQSLFGEAEEAAAKSEEEKATAEVELGVIDGDRAAAHERALHIETQERSENEALVAKRNIKFHFMMAACAMYMAMLLTNWGSTSTAVDIEYQDGQLEGQAYDLSVESMWIKFATQWATLILYGWSVIAPTVCKNRDFS